MATKAQMVQFREALEAGLVQGRFKGQAAKVASRILRLRNERQALAVQQALYGRFLASGGKPGDWQSFLQWLIEHGPEIVAFIQALIAIFSKL